MTRKLIWSVILVVFVVIIAGCGGGGGSRQPIGNESYILTGTIKDNKTNAAVVGATVKVGEYQGTTNSSGKFTIEMPSAPDVLIYSIDGEHATPSPGYYDYWARIGNCIQSAKCIVLPQLQRGTNSLGTIYLLNMLCPPPYPPSCPS